MLKLFVVCTALALGSVPLAHGQEGQGGPVKAVMVPYGTLKDSEVIKTWVAQCRDTPTSCDRDAYQVREWGSEWFELFVDDPRSYENMLRVSANIVLVDRRK